MGAGALLRLRATAGPTSSLGVLGWTRSIAIEALLRLLVTDIRIGLRKELVKTPSAWKLR